MRDIETSVEIPAAARPFAAAAARIPNMTCRQMAILATISATPGLSNKDYVAALGYAGPVVTRALDEFERHGLIRRRMSLMDRRKNILHVLPAGRALLAALEARTDETRAEAA